MAQNITPAPGTPATQPYVTDSQAHVVTRVSKSGRTLWTRRVELGPVRYENENLAEGEPPVTLQDGILDQPYGPEIQWTLRRNGRWMRGRESRLTLGHSVRRVDYKM